MPWKPQRYFDRPSYLGVGVMDVAFYPTPGNPWYMTPVAYRVQGDLRPLEPNTAYTNQGMTPVSIDPMGQGFAGELALQQLIALQNSNTSNS